MKEKINKLIITTIACVATMATLNSCQTTQQEKVIKDCSSIFENRYVGDTSEKNNMPELTDEEKMSQSKTITECKILEITLNNHNKCELVGSDKIEDLSKIISENKGKKLILIAPESQLRDLIKMAQKHVSSNILNNLKQHFDSDIFNSLDFPYKGMRCVIADKKVVVWHGNKQVILTVENK